MEDRERFISRFSNHKEMIDLFNDIVQRKDIASEIFQDRWDNAIVTVTKINGERFFID